MKATHGYPVPSASLLRFLRCQLTVQSSAIVRSSTTPQLPLSQSCRPYHTTRDCGRHMPGIIRHTNHERLVPTHTNSRCYSATPRGSAPTGSSQSQRSLSTSSTLREGFWRRLRPTIRSSPSDRYRNDQLPPLPGFLDDTAGLSGRIIKPSNELKLRCTELDENGNVTLVNGEFRKHELIAKYSLLPRDLRKIDSSVLPHILVRPSAILINLLHIRCLIKSDRVLVFDVYGSTDSYAQSLFMYDLEGKLRQKQTNLTAGGALPYEFRALEAVLISVTSGLESEFEGVREPVVGVLRDLEEDIDREKLRHLLIFSKKLNTFEQKARLVRDAIDDILEADDDLAAMYLTEKAAGTEREEDNHEEVELLLESYHKVTDEIVQVSSNLVSSIKNTEDIIRAILDANRNSLMLLEIRFSILTLGTTVGMFIAALYGMNLHNYIEETHYGFAGISGLCVVLTMAATVWGMKRLRKVQRVSMWGEGGSLAQARALGRQSGRGSFRELDVPHASQRYDRGLGETVAGIKNQEAMRNWQTQKEKQIKQAKETAEALPPATTSL